MQANATVDNEGAGQRPGRLLAYRLGAVTQVAL
jgi:hypothetical protein